MVTRGKGSCRSSCRMLASSSADALMGMGRVVRSGVEKRALGCAAVAAAARAVKAGGVSVGKLVLGGRAP